MKAKRTTGVSIAARVAGTLCLLSVISCARHETSAPAAVEQHPPAIQYEAHVPAGGRVPGGGELNNPLAGNPAAAKNGAALFSAMNCDGCHGGDGSGWVGPSLADGRWRYGGAENEIFSSIYYGRPKGMPAFGGVLESQAIWSIVTYLKSLPPPPNVPTESWDD